MKKSSIFKTFIWTVIFTLLVAILYYLLTCQFDLKADAGIDRLHAGWTVDVLTDPLKTVKAFWDTAFKFDGKDSIYAGLTGPDAFRVFEHSLPSLAFCATGIVFVIGSIMTIVNTFRFRKPSLLLNIVWGFIVCALIAYGLGCVHIFFYGPNAVTTIATENAYGIAYQNGYFKRLVWPWTDISLIPNNPFHDAFAAAEVTKKIQIGGITILAYLLVIFMLAVVISGITYIVKIMVHTHQHKYDYLTKRERKQKIKYYKEHGLKNVSEKKGKETGQFVPGQDQPYVPYGYAPYGYGYANAAYPQQPQIVSPNGGNSVQTGNNAPLIVQYITNSDGAQLKSSKANDTTEIYASRAQAIKPDTISKDDVKDAVLDVLRQNNLLVSPTLHVSKPEPVKEEVKEEKADSVEDKYDLLTIDDLVKIIKDTVGEKEVAAPVKEEIKEEPKEEVLTIDDIKKIVDEAICEKEPKEALKEEVKEEKSIETNEVKADETKIIPPIVVAIPSKVEEETEEEPAVEEEEEDRISEDDLRALVKAELVEALKDIKVKTKETVKEVPVYVHAPVQKEVIKEVPVIKEVIKEVPVTKEVIKEVPVTKEVVKEVPVIKEVVKEVPAPTPEPVVEKPVKRPLIKQPEVRGKESVIEKGEAIKLNFNERVLTGGAEIILAYNNIKNLLLSYGLKDRLSNSGDTFRLHKVTYCKITMGGSHLKLYLALDPKIYKNSAIPVADASFKDLYKDIPLVFRVKSDLSLRRARDLINDCMSQHGITKVMDEGNIDYASELKSL